MTWPREVYRFNVTLRKTSYSATIGQAPAFASQSQQPPFLHQPPAIDNSHPTLECATCGDKFWECDLTAVNLLWFDQPDSALLCEDCLAPSEQFQGVYEDLDNAPELLGQMEIVLPTV